MKSNGHWMALVIFALLSLTSVYFYDVLSGAYLLTERDLRVFFIPPRFLWVELVKNGTFPLWNPYHLNGHPLFANLQPGVFYPLSIIYFILPFDLAFNYTIVLHFFLSGLFTFLLLRRLNASYTASLISAITFMLSGYLLSVHNLMTHLLSVAWAPLVFLLFLLGLQKGSLKFIIFSALSACAMFLGGGVEIVYVTIVMICLLTFFWGKVHWHGQTSEILRGACPERKDEILRSAQNDKRRAQNDTCVSLSMPPMSPMVAWTSPACPCPLDKHGQTSLSVPPSFYKKVSYLGIFIAIFLGLSAVQLLPFIELSAHSIRSGGISYKEATLWSMHPKDLLQFFLPDLYGYALHPEKYWDEQNWLKTIYLGTIPFLLSIFFFLPFFPKARTNEFVHATHFFQKSRWGILLIIIGSLILAFGGHTPVYFYLYEYVPFFNKIRYPVKFLFLTTIVISVTAGLGYDRLRDGINVKQRATSNEQRAKSYSLLSTHCSLLILSFFTALAFGYLNFFEAGISSFLKSKGFDAPTYNDLFVNIHNMKRLLCITTIFGLVVFVGLKRGAAKKFLPSAILLLLTFDLFFAVQGFYHKTPSEIYHGTSSNMDFVLSDKSLFRIFTTPKTMKGDTFVVVPTQPKETDFINVELEKVSPGLNVERHIFDTWGSEVMIIKRIQNLYNLITTAPKADSTNLLSLMNVKYVISVPKIESNELKLVKMNVPATEDQLDDLEKGKTIKVYQNLHCLPRAFLVKDYKVVSSEEECKNIMQSKEFNPAELLLLEENPVTQHNLTPPISPPSQGGDKRGVIDNIIPCPPSQGGDKGGVIDNIIPSPPSQGGDKGEVILKIFLDPPSQGKEQKKIVEKVEITRYNANTISLQADVAEPKFLFMSETYCPGWKAYIDGKEAHIYRANYAFRALFLEPGEHTVEFVYDPWTFKAGLIITAITVCVIGFLLVRLK